MPRILSLDDEPTYHKMILHALQPLGYQVETASNGAEGLRLARTFQPDLVITDVMMPDITGYEVTRRLRRDPQFAHTPILVLTSQAELEDKIKSFEAGADDHVTKPFQPAELAARVAVLLRRAESLKVAHSQAAPQSEKARLIAVHSLRGGVGCTSFAVNLALGLAGLWERPTLLVDLVLTAGQVALMLNAPLRRTWADIARIAPEELDMETLHTISGQHETKMEYILAPTYPTEGEMLTGESLTAALQLALPHYEYIIADLPHDFSAMAVAALDAAEYILMVITPDMSSVRAAVAALDTYTKLGYKPDKIKVLLNWTFPRFGLAQDKIEAALGRPITLTIPFTPDKFVEAINLGQPLVFARPTEPISALLEDLAFHLSRERHQKFKPATPSAAWRRVYKRFSERKK